MNANHIVSGWIGQLNVNARGQNHDGVRNHPETFWSHPEQPPRRLRGGLTQARRQRAGRPNRPPAIAVRREIGEPCVSLG